MQLVFSPLSLFVCPIFCCPGETKSNLLCLSGYGLVREHKLPRMDTRGGCDSELGMEREGRADNVCAWG